MARLLLLLLPLAFTSCGLIQTPPRETPHSPFVLNEEETRTPLLVFSHGHHTGLTLPTSAVKDQLPELATALPGKWLEFGWGDEGFYRTERVSLTLALRALAYPTRSVMHISTTNEPLHATYAYSPAKLYLLDDQQKKALLSFLEEEFEPQPDGRLLDLGPGRYGVSRFYRARRSFFYPRTCNSWTSQALRTTGLKVHATTAPGLWRQISKD